MEETNHELNSDIERAEWEGMIPAVQVRPAPAFAYPPVKIAYPFMTVRESCLLSDPDLAEALQPYALPRD